MKRSLWLLAILPCLNLICATLITAQTAPTKNGGSAAADETPKFFSRSKLVLVPVLVTDKSGNHISGLSKDSFILEQDGKTQKVSVFEEVKAEKSEAAKPNLPRLEGHSNFVPTDEPQMRLTIVLLDMINTPLMDQSETKKYLINFLANNLKTDEPITLLGLNWQGLQQLHPFTTDKAVLVEALQTLKGQISFGEMIAPVTRTSLNAATSTVGSGASGGAAGMTAQMRQGVGETSARLENFIRYGDEAIAASSQRDLTRKTLNAMRHIAQAYAVIPGRKTLIWATRGFPYNIYDPTGGENRSFLLDEYQRTLRELVSANVAVYSVDIGGITNWSSPMSEVGTIPFLESSNGPQFGPQLAPEAASPDGSYKAYANAPRGGTYQPPPPGYDASGERYETLKEFAQQTGGHACLHSNGIETCFSKALQDSRAYYMLAYYLDSSDTKPGYRKLTVKVAAQGATVRHRQGVTVTADSLETPESHRKQVFDALASSLEYTGVHITVKQVPATATSGTAPAKQLQFLVAVAANSLMVDRQNGNSVDFSVVTAAFDSNGKQAAGAASAPVATKLDDTQMRNLGKVSFGVNAPVTLPPGKYDVRFAVRDNLNGQVGTAIIPVEVN